MSIVEKIGSNGVPLDIADKQARETIGNGTLNTQAQTLIGGVNEVNSNLAQLIKSKKVHGTTESNGNLAVSASDIPITSKILSVIPQRQSGYYSGMFSCTVEVNAAQTAYLINCADYTTSPPSRISQQNVEVEIIYTELLDS